MTEEEIKKIIHELHYVQSMISGISSVFYPTNDPVVFRGLIETSEKTLSHIVEQLIRLQFDIIKIKSKINQSVIS